MSAFTEVASTYEVFGKDDPFYAVLTYDEYRKGKLDKKKFYQTGQHRIDSVLEQAEQLHITISRGQALDFGCGVGRLTNALASHFTTAVGVDVSSSMIETAIEHCQYENCRFVVNKQQDLSLFQDDEFDFIFSDITIQHIPKPASENYLREFVRLLRPGGIAVFLVPNGPNYPEGSFSSRIDNWHRQKFRPWFKRVRGKHAVHVHRIAQERVAEIITSAGGNLLHTEVSPDFKESTRRYLPLFYWVQKSAA